MRGNDGAGSAHAGARVRPGSCPVLSSSELHPPAAGRRNRRPTVYFAPVAQE